MLPSWSHAPCDPSEFEGERDGDGPEGFLLRVLSDPVGHGRRLVLRVADDGRCADDEQAVLIAVPLVRDPTRRASTPVDLPRCEPEADGELATRPELTRICGRGGHSRSHVQAAPGVRISIAERAYDGSEPSSARTYLTRVARLAMQGLVTSQLPPEDVAGHWRAWALTYGRGPDGMSHWRVLLLDRPSQG